MKIKEINLTGATIRDLGLKPIVMKRLSKLVVIAGKNGVGKTRLLQAIRRCAEQRFELRGADLDAMRAEVGGLQATLDTESYDNRSKTEKQLEKTRSDLDFATALHVDAPAQIKLPLISFVPKTLSIATLQDQTLGTIAERARQIRAGGVDLLSESVFSYIYTIQRNWFEATHPEFRHRIHPDHTTNAGVEYKRLQNQIRTLLDAELGRSPEGEPTLFGYPLDEQKLSDGQKVLLHLAVAIHARGQSLKDVILLLDEPENHLHPSVLVNFIDELSEKIGSGQIWVCTHSLPLVAHLASIDPYCVWHMDANGVMRAGRSPHLILDGLMGEPKTIDSLRDFLKLPHQLAVANFASQCLAPPQVVESTSRDDPQLLAISKCVQDLRRGGKPVRLLDYGAGKGRLLSGLQEQYAVANSALPAHVSYHAFDIDTEHQEICETVIASVYTDGARRYFDNFDALIEADASFDVVVLTNVLHEIHPDAWEGVFCESGISSILSPDGWLLIVEDYHLPVGERAHEFGFLLLNTDELKELFGVSQEESDKLFRWSEQDSDGRIKAHLVHASLVRRFNRSRQRQAVGSLRTKALREIRTVRTNTKPDYATGQRLGLWTQLFANASLFLDSDAPSSAGEVPS